MDSPFFFGIPNISSSVSVKESHLRAAVEAVESVKGVKEGRSKGRITRKEGRKSKRGEGEVNYPLPPFKTSKVSRAIVALACLRGLRTRSRPPWRRTKRDECDDEAMEMLETRGNHSTRGVSYLPPSELPYPPPPDKSEPRERLPGQSTL